MGTISQYHDAAGWAAVLLVAFLISGAMVTHWLRRDLKSMGQRCRDVLLHPPHRLMAGTALIFTGAMVRLAVELPGKPMLLAHAWGWLDWWNGVSAWIGSGGALTIVAGLTVMMWPALHRRFGRATLPSIIGGAGVVYAAGVAAVVIAAQYF
jgi:hypothetical protein